MPQTINGRTYYRTLEACAKIGISRATLFRWLKAGVLERRFKDRRGWGIFTEEDIVRIQAEARRVEIEYIVDEGTLNKTQPGLRKV
jgi:predicted site-specific integrase-resolvase